MAGYFVKVLSALVKVGRRAEDGSAAMRPAGLHPHTGEPLLIPDVRTVNLQKGDELPDDVAASEIDRLLALDPPAIGRKAPIRVMGGSDTPAAPAKSDKATDLGTLASLDDAQLAKLIAEEAPGVKKLLVAVGSDAALAERLLAAEKQATSGDPRAGLVKGLEKVIAAGSAG